MNLIITLYEQRGDARDFVLETSIIVQKVKKFTTPRVGINIVI